MISSVGYSVFLSPGNEGKRSSTKWMGPPDIIKKPSVAVRQNRYLKGFFPWRSKESKEKNQRLSSNEDMKGGGGYRYDSLQYFLIDISCQAPFWM